MPWRPLPKGRCLRGALAGVGCVGGGEGGGFLEPGALGEFPGLGRMNLSLELQFDSIFSLYTLLRGDRGSPVPLL